MVITSGSHPFCVRVIVIAPSSDVDANGVNRYIYHVSPTMHTTVTPMIPIFMGSVYKGLPYLVSDSRLFFFKLEVREFVVLIRAQVRPVFRIVAVRRETHRYFAGRVPSDYQHVPLDVFFIERLAVKRW